MVIKYTFIYKMMGIEFMIVFLISSLAEKSKCGNYVMPHIPKHFTQSQSASPGTTLLCGAIQCLGMLAPMASDLQLALPCLQASTHAVASSWSSLLTTPQPPPPSPSWPGTCLILLQVLAQALAHPCSEGPTVLPCTHHPSLEGGLHVA